MSEGEADEGEEWSGISSSASLDKGKDKQKEEEYEYEEQVATVTVVEDFDPDELIHGPQITRGLLPTADEDTRVASTKDPASEPPSQGSQNKTVPKSSGMGPRAKPKSKPKDIKYQTNAARKADKLKQRRRKVEKAERAGGKASRKSGGSHKRR